MTGVDGRDGGGRGRVAVAGGAVAGRAGAGLLEATEVDRELAAFARALAHPARVAIVRYLLNQGERVCTDLSGVLPLAHSTAMQHLKVLKQAGLLASSRDGRNVYYCVSTGALRRVKALIGEL